MTPECFAVCGRSPSDFYVSTEQCNFTAHVHAVYYFSKVSKLRFHCKQTKTTTVVQVKTSSTKKLI